LILIELYFDLILVYAYVRPNLFYNAHRTTNEGGELKIPKLFIMCVEIEYRPGKRHRNADGVS